MLLLLMVLLVLLNPELPSANTAFEGRVPLTEVMSLLFMVLSSFPVLVPVLT